MPSSTFIAANRLVVPCATGQGSTAQRGVLRYAPLGRGVYEQRATGQDPGLVPRDETTQRDLTLAQASAKAVHRPAVGYIGLFGSALRRQRGLVLAWPHSAE